MPPTNPMIVNNAVTDTSKAFKFKYDLVIKRLRSSLKRHL